MKRIYKYKVLTKTTELEIHKNAKIINCINQNNELTIYALIDINEPIVKRNAHVVGTGHDISEEFLEKIEYVNTVPLGIFVWHIFINKEEIK